MGWNTSTVALRVAGGDETGSLEYEIVKYGHESHGKRTALARAGSNCKRPVLSSETESHINKPANI
jgi:hypothetical protein